MAYMSQERKAIIAANLKKIMPAGWKYTLGVRNHSTIVFTLRQAPVDILGNIREALKETDFGNSYGAKGAVEVKGHWSVNEYYVDTQFSGKVREVMLSIRDALMEGNHNNSDPMTDYFDVGWYVDINIGLWNNPFLDTIPADMIPAVKKAARNTKKLEFSKYEMFLPSQWESMTAGKKAAATKRAKAQYEASVSA